MKSLEEFERLLKDYELRVENSDLYGGSLNKTDWQFLVIAKILIEILRSQK